MEGRYLFTSGSGLDVVGVLRLGTSGLGVTSGAAEERPDDAAEVLRDALAHQLLDVAVPLLVASVPVGHQAAPQAPLVLLAVARIARAPRRLLTLARSCSISTSRSLPSEPSFEDPSPAGSPDSATCETVLLWSHVPESRTRSQNPTAPPPSTGYATVVREPLG